MPKAKKTPTPKPKVRPVPKPKSREELSAEHSERMQGNTSGIGNRGNTTKFTARPNTKLSEELCERAYDLTLLGYTLDEVAEELGISLTTLRSWLANDDKFYDSVHSARAIADGKAARGLFKRAVGMTIRRTTVVATQLGPRVVSYNDEIPPDAGAAAKWLSLRQPKLWREALSNTGYTPEEAAALVRKQLEAMRTLGNIAEAE